MSQSKATKAKGKMDLSTFIRSVIKLEKKQAIAMIEQHASSLYDSQFPERIQVKEELKQMDEQLSRMEKEEQKLRAKFLAEPRYLRVTEPKKSDDTQVKKEDV